jgi:hypothetical protein
MEEAGSMVALLFVVLVTWFTGSMRKALKEENDKRHSYCQHEINVKVGNANEDTYSHSG